MTLTFGEIEPIGPWTAYIQAMDQALSEGGPGDSVCAWRQAYSVALSYPGWSGLLIVAAAALRLRVFASLAQSAAAHARETYWIAFFRARQQRSLDGVLYAAEAFAQLGDRSTVEKCLRCAEALAARAGDSAHAERVRLRAARLAELTIDAERSGVVRAGAETG
jgi:hypothetical protein